MCFRAPSTSPFEIYDASALSLNKKQSSTYYKYACGCFLYAPSICIVYFKRLTEKGFSKPPRTAVVPSRSEICVICTNLVVRTPKDGRDISQKQVLEQNLSSTDDVHGRTSVERYTDVHCSTGLRQKDFIQQLLWHIFIRMKHLGR